MRALDQAFIKAFSQQGASPVVLPRESVAPIPEPQPSAVVPKKEAVALKKEVAAPIRESAAPMKEVVAPKKETAALPISDVFRDMLATLPASSGSAANASKEERPSLPISAAKQEASSKALSQCSEEETATGGWADSWQSSLDTSGFVCIAEPVCTVEPVQSSRASEAESFALPKSISLPKPVRPANSTPPVVERPVVAAAPVAAQVECEPSPVAVAVEPPPQWNGLNSPTSMPGDAPSTYAPLSAFMARENEETPPPAFKPASQVDRFTWPRVCRRLMAKANDEFDRLADALLTAKSHGQKVLAMAGCSQGEGATTLLLCAARRLAERGVKLALVDADLARPRLAKRLGVQPQMGWNETSEQEGVPVDRAVVQASSNGLTLASVHDPVSPTGHTSGDWSQLAPCIEKLKENYDMVLVDLGPLEKIESMGDALARVVDEKIDAVLLVHNRRITSAERLTDVERQLTASGVPLAGMIENFVAV